MATKEEVISALSQVGTLLDKVSGETTSLVAEVAALKEQIANAEVPEEIVAAVEAVASRAAAIDGLVTDLQQLPGEPETPAVPETPPPAEQPEG